MNDKDIEKFPNFKFMDESGRIKFLYNGIRDNKISKSEFERLLQVHIELMKVS
jgi:hypothetical protein